MIARNEFRIGDKVSGYGALAIVRGVVIGISENPPSVEVKWDNPALMQTGRDGRWEEIYNVQKISD